MTVHPDYRGKATKGGALTKKVLFDFLNEPQLMHRAAETIRAIAPETPTNEVMEPPGWDVAFVDDVDYREGKLLASRHLSDLILLCSNCHRMVHYRPQWLSPEHLREVLGSAAMAPVDLDAARDRAPEMD